MATSLLLEFIAVLRKSGRQYHVQIPRAGPRQTQTFIHVGVYSTLYNDICHEQLDSVVYVSYTISMHSTPDHDLLTLTHMNWENMHWN